MKAIKLNQSLVFGLVLAVATAGCRHNKNYGTTPLPGTGPGTSGSGGGVSGSGKIESSGGVSSGPGGGETADFDLANMNQDRAALAAYTVHFAYDSALINASEKPLVESVAAVLKSDAGARLLIEGHCDERGTEEYNRSLGERRALALREELATQGVDPMRVRTVSFGEDKPVAMGHDEAAWKKNRRGEFVLLHPK
jgi:peptidoglycan-associated lipoprotein